MPGDDRVSRALDMDGQDWLAVEALRSRSGHLLVYFLPIDGGEPTADDRRDRRGQLEPGERLDSADAARLEAVWAGATGLTETERRFVDTEGVPWLAQNWGPVWADEGVAGGLTGLVFTRLEGSYDRRRAPGGHVAALTPDALRRAVEDADPG